MNTTIALSLLMTAPAEHPGAQYPIATPYYHKVSAHASNRPAGPVSPYHLAQPSGTPQRPPAQWTTGYPRVSRDPRSTAYGIIHHGRPSPERHQWRSGYEMARSADPRHSAYGIVPHPVPTRQVAVASAGLTAPIRVPVRPVAATVPTRTPSTPPVQRAEFRMPVRIPKWAIERSFYETELDQRYREER